MINVIFAAILTPMKKYICILVALFFGLSVMAQVDTVQFEGETHFKNVQQLTFGGDNAEAYWSFDSKRIIFQNLVWNLVLGELV
jgi:TolB protein